MDKVNVFYNKQTNTWWIDKNFDGFTFRDFIKKNITGLGHVEFKTNDISKIKDLYQINSAFVPDYMKKMNGITEELEKNGLDNFIQISEEELDEILK